MQAALAALGTVDQLDIPELIGPSRSWKSLTPFGLVRHPKTRRGVTTDSPEDQLRCELEHRGITKPVEIRLERGSWHRFRSSKVGTSRLARARLFGVHMRFSGPMQGPLALGALSHYGLGLMQPDD
jgi:CRISPR-associated protein Csb2